MSKVILTYEEGLSEDLALGVGYSYQLVDEGSDYFIISFRGKNVKIDKNNFSAYGEYDGKECLVVLFNENDECVIVQEWF